MEKVKFIDGKRVSARGIIIQDDSVYLMFRRRIKDDGNIKEYYVIPGGGIDESETEEQALIREMQEELSVSINILGKVGVDISDNSIANFYSLEITNGTPTLGGEELEKNSQENYYEIRLIKLSDLNSIDVTGTSYIQKAYNKEYLN